MCEHTLQESWKRGQFCRLPVRTRLLRVFYEKSCFASVAFLNVSLNPFPPSINSQKNKFLFQEKTSIHPLTGRFLTLNDVQAPVFFLILLCNVCSHLVNMFTKHMFTSKIQSKEHFIWPKFLDILLNLLFQDISSKCQKKTKENETIFVYSRATISCLLSHVCEVLTVNKQLFLVVLQFWRLLVNRPWFTGS